MSDDVMLFALRAATATLKELTELLADIVAAADSDGPIAYVPSELVRAAHEALSMTPAGREALARHATTTTRDGPDTERETRDGRFDVLRSP
jgi:hypothetical protein